MIAVTILVWCVPRLQHRLVSTEILTNLTMLQYPLGVPGVSAVFWTMWMELHFYLLFAIVVWRGTTYRRVVTFCMLWTVASVFAASVRDPMVSWIVDEAYSPFFIGGIVLYLMYRFRPTLLLWCLLGVSWTLALLKTVPVVKGSKTFIGHELPWKPAAIVVTGIFAVVAAAVLLPKLATIRSRALTVAGALTYPLYLLHLEAGWLVIRLLHGRVPAWPLVLGLIMAMLGLAYLVHRWVERPLAAPMRRMLLRAVAELRHPPDEPAGAGGGLAQPAGHLDGAEPSLTGPAVPDRG